MIASPSIDNDILELQRDECEAISAMFADDVTVLNECPISYSIKLRPSHEEVEDASLWPWDEYLVLKVTYPSNYPNEAPMFDLIYSDNVRMHPIQENALLAHIKAVAEMELGTPCILSCFYAAREFFNNIGLIQAALSMLSDDCLACILSYLANAKEDIDTVVASLPLFAGVYKTDIVWKELCCNRWKAKWGFSRRWKKALEDFDQHSRQTVTVDNHKKQHSHLFWFHRYEFEERDCKRRAITRDELCHHPFEMRQWFSHHDPFDVRSAQNVLPSGLRQPCHIAKFTLDGVFLGPSDMVVQYSFNSANPNTIVTSSRWARDLLTIRRTPDWGWQLNNNDFVMRSKDDEEGEFASSELLWKDLTSNIVMEERPPGVESRFNWREIPDDEELQFEIPWRNSWRYLRS